MPQEVDPSRRRSSNTVTRDKRPGNGKGEDRSGRPWVWYLHSLFGIKLSLFLLFVSVTGTAAVVSDEIEWLVYPEARASASSAQAGWETRYHAAVQAFPLYTVTFLEAGEEPYLATRVFATAPDGTSRVIFVDPTTGRVTGERSWATLRAFLRALHYTLFAPDDWGFFPVTLLGFVLLGSLITGVLISGKFWRSGARRPRTGKGPRIFWGDVHRLIGVWSCWFVLIMAVTSIWYFAERLVWRAGIDWDPSRSVISVEGLGASADNGELKRLPLEALLQKARQALPSLEVRRVSVPVEAEDTLVVGGQTTAWLVRDRTNRVEIHPYTGDVVSLHRAENMGLLERWVHTADPLHFGDFGGLVSKLVWVVFGMILCLIALSGAVIHIRRLTAGPVASPREQTGLGFQGNLRAYLDSMGGWKWINLFFTLVVPVAGYFVFWNP